MAVKRSLRFQILRRDNHACRYCGAKAPDAKLTVDHVVPEALGGTDDPGNLVTACDECNGGKSATPPDSALVADVQRDAIRWAHALKSAAEMLRLRREECEAYVNYFDALWSDWTTGNSKQLPRDDNWRSSIERLYECGLDPDDLKYAVRQAMENGRIPPANTYRYFCGICWRILRQMREIASDIVMAEVEDEVNELIEREV